jgi:nucleotide-binding universal stress UspA family protein
MKILVGVDAHRRCQPVIVLLGRLNFADATAIALSVVEEPTSIGLAVPPDMGAAISLDISRITEAAQQHAHKTAEEAAKTLEEYGINAEPKIVFGGAADKLEEAASDMKADLIAVGSEGKGTLESLIFGSVSSALCSHANTSVLVGKGEVAKEGKVRAVFATDLSKYATKCLHRFVEMSSQGLSKVTLMSAYQVTINQRADMFGIPGVEPAIEEGFRDQIEKKMQHDANALKSLGCEVETLLKESEPNEGIAQAMKETGADLLIVGAKGHSAVERFLLGSVAHYQISHGQYPVLVVRA